MANLTISIDDEVLKRARMKALEQGVSVNGIIRDYLERYSSMHSEVSMAIDSILELSKKSDSARGGAHWTRDDLHERK
jgi:hypothetical protein